jgi:protein TonB
MADAAQPVLPRTRTLRRGSSLRRWWIAIGVAMAVNLGLIVILAEASRLQAHAAPTPPITRPISRSALPPPPPQTTNAALAPSAATLVPVALPPLELPMAATPEPALPDAARLLDGLALPLVVPPFAGRESSSGADLAATSEAPGPTWDEPAQLEGAFDLDRFYPRSAKRTGTTGTTRISLDISASGEVTGVRVLASEPTGVFEHAAEQMARTLRFRPATEAGRPVASIYETSIQWTLR